MTDLCTIGPVSIEPAMLWDNNEFSASNDVSVTRASGATIFTPGVYQMEERFSIICSFDEALQIKGLMEIGEPVWINTSSDLTDNDYFQHKGWYLLTSVDFEHLNPAYMQCDIECQLIATHLSEYLTMDYTTGQYDGLKLDYSYVPTSTVYQLQDDGSATTNFSSVRKVQQNGSTPTATFATDSTELDFAINSATDGNVAVAWVRTNNKYTVPCTIETVLDRNSLPGAGAYNAQLGMAFSKEDMQTWQGISKNGPIEWFEYAWQMNSAASYDAIYISRSGSWSIPRSFTSVGTANAEMGLKFILELDGTIEVLTDYDTTGTWTSIYKGPSMIQNLHEGIYIYFQVVNYDSTSWTGSFQKLDIYNSDETNPDYVVAVPYNSTRKTTATGHRHGEDGDIYYYTNPTTELRFQVAQADMYKGAVKLLSTNNATTTSRQAYHTDVRLTPASTILKNAFTKLEFDADEMIMYGWDSAAWNEIMDFDFGTSIDIMKPLKISHDEVWLQINDTKVHMTRSSPMISLYHPDTAVTYTLRDRFWYNGALDATIAAADDITMTDTDDGYYSYTYNNAADTYRCIFGKKDPTTIKSDSLPADDITGIGWYEKTMSGVNAPDALVRQWWKQTRTGVSMKQII